MASQSRWINERFDPGKANGVAAGDDDVGAVSRPVDGGDGDGLWHELLVPNELGLYSNGDVPRVLMVKSPENAGGVKEDLEPQGKARPG